MRQNLRKRSALVSPKSGRWEIEWQPTTAITEYTLSDRVSTGMEGMVEGMKPSFGGNCGENFCPKDRQRIHVQMSASPFESDQTGDTDKFNGSFAKTRLKNLARFLHSRSIPRSSYLGCKSHSSSGAPGR